MKNIVIFLADGFEEVEALVPIDVLRRANFNVLLCGLDKKEVTSTHNIKIYCDVVVNDIKDNIFDCIILPGGMPGTLNLKNDERVCDIVLKHYELNKLVCAICAAPSILEHLGLLKNKKAISYPGFLSNKETLVIDKRVVVDENIITSKGAGTAFDFAYTILEKLNINSRELKKTMMYE